MWQRQGHRQEGHRQQERLPKLPVRKLRQSYRQKLTFGDPYLDRVLRGGVPCGLITELTGEAAACKTQACLQLLLNAQLPLAQGGLDGDSLYIYTEGNAPLGRLQQIADTRGWSRDSGVLDRVIVKQAVHTGADLLAVLQQAQALLEDPQVGSYIRLLVVDSVANVFRDVGDNAGVRQYAARSELLFQVATLLRKLADRHNMAVVVTNQVSDLFDDDPQETAVKKAGHTGGLSLLTSGREVLPALGLAWANCINQRLFLARTLYPDGQGGVLRQMRVVFSPFLPQRQTYYMVEQAGLRGVHMQDARAAGLTTQTQTATNAITEVRRKEPVKVDGSEQTYAALPLEEAAAAAASSEVVVMASGVFAL